MRTAVEIAADLELLRPHLIAKAAEQNAPPPGASVEQFENARVREFLTARPLAGQVLASWCPPTGGFLAAAGVTMSPPRRIEPEYTNTDHTEDLFRRELLPFAEPWDGSQYYIDLNTGAVTRGWSGWSDDDFPEYRLENQTARRWETAGDFAQWVLDGGTHGPTGAFGEAGR